jgi:Domain of unknown function (DUF3854)
VTESYQIPASSKPLRTPPPLSEAHRWMLEEESGISPEVIAARGYWTVSARAQLVGTFPKWQRRAPALFVPMFSPDGVTTRAQIRPNNPRTDKRGKVVKYETAHRERPILDVHPSMLEALRDASRPILFTEGVKTADSATSRGLCTVAFAGVDGWVSGGKPLPCWEHIALSGRKVFVAYDSDVMTKPGVQGALGRLASYLEGRGATVWVIYLPAAPDGSKQGVDDYLAAGGTVAEMMLLARPYSAEDLAGVRLGRDEELRAAVARLSGDWRQMPARKRRENTARSVVRVLLEEAARSGKVLSKAGRVWVKMDRRTLASGAQTSVGSVHKAIEYLEGEGRLQRDNEGRRAERAGAFVLIPRDSAKSNHKGGREAVRGEGQEQRSNKEGIGENPAFAGTSRRGDYLLRYETLPDMPELRWPRLILYWAREKGRRKVVDSHYVARLGKQRAAIILHVLEAGGSAPVEDLMDRFASARTRPWDFKRRTLGPIVEAGIFAPVLEESVSLTEGWRVALERRRAEDGELEDAERQRARYEKQRRAFRRRHEYPADTDEGPLLGAERMAEILEERRKDEERRWIEAQRQKVGTTAAVFLSDELQSVAAVRWRELRERWLEHGGKAEDLRQAVTHGPFRFEREHTDDNALYVYPGSTVEERETPASVAVLHDLAPRPQEEEPVAEAVAATALPELENLQDHSVQVSPSNLDPKMRTTEKAKRPPPRVQPYKRADGVYVHPPDCACEWCGEELEPSCATPLGSGA